MNIKEIRIEKGYDSARKVAELLGIPYSTYMGYESSVREPDYKTLLKFADFFGVSTDALLGRSEKGKQIPVLGLIRAGLPLLAEQNYSEEITVGQFEKDADFALRVTGDSMIYAGIREGDIVLMQQAERAVTGQIVAAVVHDMDCMATLKYFINGRAPVLRAANPKYPDQPITSSHRIIGVYCGLVRTEEPSLHEYQELIARAESVDDEWREALAELTAAGLGPEEVKSLLTMMRKIKK